MNPLERAVIEAADAYAYGDVNDDSREERLMDAVKALRERRIALDDLYSAILAEGSYRVCPRVG